MNLLLCALTGMGNEVLAALAASPDKPEVRVVTRRETGPFPYYDCPPLEEDCRKLGALCSFTNMRGSDGYALVEHFRPDVILAATFHQVIPSTMIGLVRVAANIHPSLLPLYRGPTPTNWAVAHGEKQSGVTVHLLEKDVDAGEIIFQKSQQISGMTDGEVRRALNSLAGACIPEFLEKLTNSVLETRPNEISKGNRFPAITSPEGLLLLKNGAFSPENIKLALTPYPGPSYWEEAYDKL